MISFEKTLQKKCDFFVQDFHFLSFFAEAFEEKILQYGETNTFWSQTGAPDWTKIRRQI